MSITRAIKVSPPPMSLPLITENGTPTRAFTDFLYQMWVRSGGNEDKPEAVREQAGAAQGTANSAQESANTAQGTADTGVEMADTAQGAAETGISKADTAQGTADTGVSKADTAQEQADEAYSLADFGKVPIGGIMPIAGGFTIPSNWALCDGSKGTPDLRDRFIVAAGTIYAAGSTGGSDEAEVTTAQGGSGSTATGTASISTTTAGAATGADVTAVVGVTAGGHTHSIADHEHTVTVPTVPPYYAMAMIMRTE